VIVKYLLLMNIWTQFEIKG